MERRRIGSLEVSVVGLGCNNFGRRLDAAATAAVVDAARDAGVSFFDTADMYGNGQSEEFLGRALGPRRGEVIVATKFGYRGGGRVAGADPASVRRAVEESLTRLGTDYIDLYQLHQPHPETPIADTLGALDDLVRQGKVREIGCSNFSAAQLREAAEAVRSGGARFVSVQNEYSLLHREPEDEGVLAECERRGAGFLPWYPLASGLLTGKYLHGATGRISEGGNYAKLMAPWNVEATRRLADFAASKGRTLLDLAFSWLLARPVVASVIAGATSPEQVRANVAAAGWRMSDAERAAADALTAGHRWREA